MQAEIKSSRSPVSPSKMALPLEGKVSALEASQDTQGENEVSLLRIINDLRKYKEPQPLQLDRSEILRALITANGGKFEKNVFIYNGSSNQL